MPTPIDAGTRQRLLEAGRKVFAEHGLANARTRDICALAKANVAAVNYHFGSKERLYITVLAEHMRTVRERHPLDAGVTPRSTPEDRLDAFIRGLLRQLLTEDDAQSASLGKLILLELVQPSQHVGVLIAEHIRPINEQLRAIVADLMPGVSPEVAAQCAASIMAQFALFRFDRQVLESIGPDFSPRHDDLDKMAESILDFTLGGIERRRVRHAR